MGAARKLQGEIDRVLKKVNEGLVDFDSIWDKVHDTENANQKEKFEADLKKEIKKLQRHRDQIKTWISSADIKDKSPLIEARKSIENEMERFKVCEKEAKTKAFSKAALGAAVKADPKETQREAARDWLSSTVDNVNQKIEELEYEAAQLQENQGKKKGGKAMTRHHEIEGMMQKYGNHTVRLEQCLRCLDNDTVAPEEVIDLKDMLDLFISPEEGCEPEDSYETVDDYYSDLIDRLDVVDMHVPSAAAAVHGKHGKGKEARGRQAKAMAGALEPVAEGEEEGGTPVSPVEPPTKAAVHAAVKAHLVKVSDEESRKAAQAQATNGASLLLPVSSALLAASAPAASAPPPALCAPAPAAGVTPSEPTVEDLPAGPAQLPLAAAPSRPSPAPVTIPSPPPISTLPPQSPSTEDLRSINAAGPSNGTPLLNPSQQLRPGAGSSAAAPTPAPAPLPMVPPPRPAAASWNTVAAAGTKPAPPPLQKPQPPAMQPPPPGAALADGLEGQAQERVVGQMNGLSMLDRAASGPPPPLQQTALQPVQPPVSAAPVQPPPGQLLQVQQQQQQQQQAQQQASAASQQQQLAEVAQQQRPGELQLGQPPPSMLAAHALMIMDGCAGRAMHQASDTDYNSKRFKARHPVGLPTSYPRAPPEILDNPGLFRKMDPEALFFAFYYQPDTYQQYLAAQELKRQSWRYHKHHNAWFQRYAEPSVTTDEYEQGTYVYFDYNIMHDDMQTGWCYRRKENFTFRYDALEDELQVVAAM